MIARIALLLCCAPFAEHHPAPAPGARPEMPGRIRVGEPIPPLTALIERDAALADRFTAEGQAVSYRFAGRAGELSLFELDTLGYERGWSSSARVRILDAAGMPLLLRERSGDSAYRILVAFTAPADGVYQYELTAVKQCFRYALVRHSQFAAHRAGEPIAMDERELRFGYLAHPRDEACYSLALRAGEEVALTVRNHGEEARRARWQARARAALAGDLERLRGESFAAAEAERGMPAQRGRPPSDYPDLVLTVESASGDAPAGFAPFSPAAYGRFVAPQTATYVVRVSCAPGDSVEGGIFELTVERPARLMDAQGFVDDDEGEPAAGVTLEFFREPALDWVGRAVSDAAGRWTLRMPPGPYLVFPQRGELSLPAVRTTLQPGRELNFVFGDAPAGPAER